MHHFIRLTDFSAEDVLRIFRTADEIKQGMHTGFLKGKSIVLFFPASSIRTRVTFEKGIYLLGGQPILFPSDTLDKKEDIRDVCGYLNQWADAVVVRHRDIHLLEKMAEYLRVPLINAMTDGNHPCEVTADLYALSKMRGDFRKENFLFVGKCGNIGLAWKEAAKVMGFPLEQCCGKGYEMDDIRIHYDIETAVVGKDIICTDALPEKDLPSFQKCQVTLDAMKKANKGALLNPCPPFYRGEEVDAQVIESPYFVGYAFKKCLLEVQQAILMDCLHE